MFDLALQNEITLPVIPFEVEPIKVKLQEALQKYDGIVFGPEEVKDLKATITELNKVEKMVEDYRKAIKKQAEAPIKEFEAKTKELVVLINQTRSEFKEAYDKIESDRKAEREKEVKELTQMIIDDSDLFEPYDTMVPFKKEYLNKSMTIGKIEDDIMMEVEKLSQQQEIRNSKVRQIEDKCKILSYELKLKTELSCNGYVKLIDYEEMDNIISIIEKDASDQQLSENAVETSAEPELVEPEPELEVEEATEIDETPELFTETWTITGTETQLLMVENFLKSNKIKYQMEGDD